MMYKPIKFSYEYNKNKFISSYTALETLYLWLIEKLIDWRILKLFKSVSTISYCTIDVVLVLSSVIIFKHFHSSLKVLRSTLQGQSFFMHLGSGTMCSKQQVQVIKIANKSCTCRFWRVKPSMMSINIKINPNQSVPNRNRCF